MNPARSRSPVPRLMLVTDRHRTALPLPTLAAAAVAGGCDAVLLREKDLPADERRRLLVEIKTAVNGQAAVLVNSDLDLAVACDIGLHLPEEGLAPTEARKRLGPGRLIGRSVHSTAAALASYGADYLLAGNVFETASHPDRPGLGLAKLTEIVAVAAIPVLAIGGIEESNVADVIAAGADGVAVIGALSSARSEEAARARARELRRAVDEAIAGRSGDSDMQQENRVNPREEVNVELNGKPASLPPDTTVAGLLSSKGLQDRLVVVEVNGAIVPRSSFGDTVIRAGDRVEVVHFVGGG